jgi:hypothetical protein
VEAVKQQVRGINPLLLEMSQPKNVKKHVNLLVLTDAAGTNQRIQTWQLALEAVSLEKEVLHSSLED